jgi:hypothetical protein
MFPPRPTTGTPSAGSLPQSHAPGIRRPPSRRGQSGYPSRPHARRRQFRRHRRAPRTDAAVRIGVARSGGTRSRLATGCNADAHADQSVLGKRSQRQGAPALACALRLGSGNVFPQRRDGVSATVRSGLVAEIKKSYEEYVEQVTREFAESTTHFQEALNDILAGGQKIF